MLGPDRSGAADVAAPPSSLDAARTTIETCNACRYCEGYCAVFPAITLRRQFTSADLTYLANLCHGCRACYYACQYAPPHEFGINVPKVLAELREHSYATAAWPQQVWTAQRSGRLAVIVTALVCALVLLTSKEPIFAAHSVAAGSFYRILDPAAMIALGLIGAFVAAVGLFLGARRFLHEMGNGRPALADSGAWAQALGDAASLRFLGGGGAGCNDSGERFSATRRRFHHSLAYGFAACFAATAIGAFYHHVLEKPAPYPLLSLPVLLGTGGGIAMLVGTAGLLWLKATEDKEPTAPGMTSTDQRLLWLLLLVALSGLALLALRETAAMASLLALHLGLVCSLFVAMPYGKFVHFIYRYAALVRFRQEQRRGAAARSRIHQ
jgi:citrate/tricarballylate utilization protein